MTKTYTQDEVKKRCYAIFRSGTKNKTSQPVQPKIVEQQLVQPKIVEQQPVQQPVQHKIVKPQINKQLDYSDDYDLKEIIFPQPNNYDKNDYRIERPYAREKTQGIQQQQQKIIPKIILSNIIPVNENKKEIEKDKKIEYDYGYIYYIKDENYDRMNDIKNCIGYTFYYNDENENQILLQTLNYDNIYYIDLTDENNLLYDSKEYENGYKNVEVGLEYQNDENNNIIISLDTEQKQQQIEKDFEINQSAEKIPDDKVRQEIAFGIVNNEIGLSDVVQQNEDINDNMNQSNFLSDIKKGKKLNHVELLQQPKKIVNNGLLSALQKILIKRREDIGYSENEDEESEPWSTDEGGFLGGYRRNKKVNYFKNNNQKNKLKQNDRIKRIKRQHINL